MFENVLRVVVVAFESCVCAGFVAAVQTNERTNEANNKQMQVARTRATTTQTRTQHKHTHTTRHNAPASNTSERTNTPPPPPPPTTTKTRDTFFKPTKPTHCSFGSEGLVCQSLCSAWTARMERLGWDTGLSAPQLVGCVSQSSCSRPTAPHTLVWRRWWLLLFSTLFHSA